jgi:hypothetical protein
MIQKIINFLKKLFGLQSKPSTAVTVGSSVNNVKNTKEYYYLVRQCETGHEESVISFVMMSPGQSFFFKYNRDQSGCYYVVSELSEGEKLLSPGLRVFDSCDLCSE